MTQQRSHRLVFAILLVSYLPICFSTETPDPTDPNRYLNAVRTFPDNVLKYGRDTYGPKHTPLLKQTEVLVHAESHIERRDRL